MTRLEKFLLVLLLDAHIATILAVLGATKSSAVPEIFGGIAAILAMAFVILPLTKENDHHA